MCKIEWTWCTFSMSNLCSSNNFVLQSDIRSCKNLQVSQLSSNLSWTNHIQHICKRLFWASYTVLYRNFFSHADNLVMKKLFSFKTSSWVWSCSLAPSSLVKRYYNPSTRGVPICWTSLWSWALFLFLKQVQWLKLQQCPHGALQSCKLPSSWLEKSIFMPGGLCRIC